MGITPITNLFPLPVTRSIPSDLDPLPMERVQSSPRTGDETYSPGGGRFARGSEDDAADDESTGPDDEAADGAPAFSRENDLKRKISFFA